MFKILNIENSSKSDFDVFYNKTKQAINSYIYFHYKNYPSKNKNDWINYFLYQLKKSFSNKNHYIFYEDSNDNPIFIIYHINKWDEKHFGIKMAKTVLVFSYPDVKTCVLTDFLDKGIKYLNNLGIKFISARINGDNLSFINAHLENNFKYYETIIWPTLNTKKNNNNILPCQILTDDKRLNEVKNIAIKYQYQRGHFHCDSNFDKNKVNSMYSKWVESSFYSDDKICIIEDNSKIVGYFVCGIDSTLTEYFGYKYGRLKSLALNNKFRGRGLGTKLFNGTINYLIQEGCEYIDSGYATKNHLSSFLHSSNSFHSKYEEISLHYWIENK